MPFPAQSGPTTRSLRWSKRLPLLLGCLAVLLAVAAIVAVGRTWLTPRTTFATEAKNVSALPNTLQSVAVQQGAVELITITPRGFEPSQISRPAGRVMLVINNKSELAETVLRVIREDGTRLREVRLPMNRRSWREAVNLPAGRYRITEANHPIWVCQIELTQ